MNNTLRLKLSVPRWRAWALRACLRILGVLVRARVVPRRYVMPFCRSGVSWFVRGWRLTPLPALALLLALTAAPALAYHCYPREQGDWNDARTIAVSKALPKEIYVARCKGDRSDWEFPVCAKWEDLYDGAPCPEAVVKLGAELRAESAGFPIPSTVSNQLAGGSGGVAGMPSGPSAGHGSGTFHRWPVDERGQLLPDFRGRWVVIYQLSKIWGRR